MELTGLSWNEEFWSHFGIPLSQHLSAVGETCKEFFCQAGISDKRLIRTAELVGKAHDFGKYTSFFQRHIRGLKVRPELKEHSPISALFSAWLIWRELKDDFLALAGFICTLRHHGNLDKDFYDLQDWLEDKFGGEDGSKFSSSKYAKQIESIRENLSKVSIEMEKIGIHGVENFIDGLPDTYSRLMRLLYSMGEAEIEDAWKNYFILLLLFSVLIDADRRDAEQLKEMREREKLDPNLVDIYREKKFKVPSSPLDPLRNRVYESTINFLGEIYLSEGIFQRAKITAPTGIGKTLLGFSIALKLREQIYKQTGNVPRIIYVLPYINIIEQTYGVLSEVLNAKEELISPYLLLKHHHQYFLEESREDIPLDEALLLHEAWDSEIIVTTFVQFFHTLIGGHKHFLRKFHNMFNSIVIIDEVQTIQMEYWELVKESIEEFTRNSSSLVIAMTATRPIIFGDWAELVPHYQKIFRNLDRVDYHYRNKEKEMEVSNMVNWFWSDIWNKNPSSALVVLNTIPSSIAAYKLIKEKFLEDEVVGLGEADEEEKIKDAERTIIAYLSTNIVPAERKRRIERIKDFLKENRKIIVVSTQVIEAGVDLNFRVAIRDIGPIDSIIQVAGRCNRSGGEKGNIHVVRIIKKDKELAPKVYGSLSIHVAKQILEEHDEFQEKEVLKIMNEYFEEGYKRKSHEKSRKILEAIKSFNFSEISKFKLIEEERKESVFIELNERARETLEKFKKILEKLQEAKKLRDIKKIFKCKVELKKKRTELESWIVAVRGKQTGRLPPIIVNGTENTSIYHVRKGEVGEYYDREIGYTSSTHAAIL